MRLVPSLDDVVSAGANAFDLYLGPGVAELAPTPRAIVDEGPQRTVYRFVRRDLQPVRRSPVLLVPPLAAPASCFDLRRRCSVAEHLLVRGHRPYVVDYGPIGFGDRDLGLEHWVDEVIPAAVEAVAADGGEGPVQLVGWCLGGIMALLAVAARELPVSSVALVASPFDFTEVRLMAPIRRLARLTGGALGTRLYRLMGGAPAPLVSLGFRLTALDRYVTKPLAVARHLHDRDWLAHMEAVDRYMASMLAYPGRSFGQLYHRFFLVNDLADGRLELDDRTIDLAHVRLPVLAVAGEADVLAPKAAVHHVAELLTGDRRVRLESAPGGHLGVLTGRSARRTTWVYLDEFLGANDAATSRKRAQRPRPSSLKSARRRPVSARSASGSTPASRSSSP